MSRIEKISFIRSFWTFREVYERLEEYPDKKLDRIIAKIIEEIRKQVEYTAVDHVLNFPVYLN
ncbi:MAG: hypothetical protein CL833_10870 [Crocinitomicaceae bacterium]|jgi:hypothetical protein|nr:hypothetical protein [Crocinitomicaceae bacterium]